MSQAKKKRNHGIRNSNCVSEVGGSSKFPSDTLSNGRLRSLIPSVPLPTVASLLRVADSVRGRLAWSLLNGRLRATLISIPPGIVRPRPRVLVRLGLACASYCDSWTGMC